VVRDAVGRWSARRALVAETDDKEIRPTALGLRVPHVAGRRGVNRHVADLAPVAHHDHDVRIGLPACEIDRFGR